jgi:exonuclease SbcD
MYKVLHCGDTHLGRKQPSKINKKRVESSIQALDHCIRKAVEEDVDFVIHAGDVFDTVYPWHSVIDAAKEKLKPLEENGIPMYVIRGNHDRSYGQGRTLKGVAIEHLENEYVHLIDPSPNEFQGHEGGYIDHDENIRIYGLGYHSNKTPSLLREFEPQGDKFNILLLHDFVDGVTRSYSDNVSKADHIAEKDLDYVAIGHDHQPNPRKEINNTTFAATGGTIDYDFNTTEFGKHYNILEIDPENGIENLTTEDVPQKLELRRLKISIENAEINAIRNRIEEISKEGVELALKISIEGKAEETDPSSIPTHEIGQQLEEELDNVVMAELILNLEIEGYEAEEGDRETFNIAEYLEKNFSDNEDLSNNLQNLHTHTTSILADDQNLTSSGFNLNKDSRQNLKEEVKEALFK